jgi:hypothetical protein
MFFIDTGAKLLGITARHVYEAYIKALEVDPRTTCQVLNAAFDLKDHLSGKGSTVDIAAFEIDRSQFDAIGRITVPWPPEVPDVGDAIVVAGFPGAARSVAPIRVTYGVYAAIAVARSVSDRDVSYNKPISEDLLVDIFGTGLPPQGYDLGGMSGGPVVRLRDGGVLSWALCGVIYECHSGFEILKAAHANCIQPDGSING